MRDGWRSSTAAYLTGAARLPRLGQRPAERAARDPRRFRARIETPVAAESEARVGVEQAGLAERRLHARVAPAVRVRHECARQCAAGDLGEAVEQRALHDVRG